MVWGSEEGQETRRPPSGSLPPSTLATASGPSAGLTNGGCVLGQGTKKEQATLWGGYLLPRPRCLPPGFPCLGGISVVLFKPPPVPAAPAQPVE